MRLTLAICLLIFSLTLLSCGDREAQYTQHMTKGDKYVAQEEYRSAISAFKAAVHLKPKSADAHFKLGKAYWEYRESLHLLSEPILLNQNKKSIKDYYNNYLDQDVLKIITKYTELSKNEFKKVIRIDKKYVQAYLLLGKTSKELLSDDYLEYYKQAMKFNPKSIEAYISLGDEYFQANFENSEKYYLKAVSIDPENPVVFDKLVTIYFIHHKKQRCLDQFNEFLTKYPNNSNVHSALSKYYLINNEFNKCNTEADLALAIDPNNPQALLCKALFSKSKNKFEDCIKYLKQIINASKDQANALRARHHLFEVLATIKHFSELIPLANDIVQIAPKSYNSYSILGDAYFYNCKYSRANKEYLKSLKMFKYQTLTEAKIATCYFKLNNFKLAQQYNENVLNALPNDTLFKKHKNEALSLKQQILAAKTKAEKESKQK